MKFLADESGDRQIVARLRQAGHTVLYVAAMEPGMADEAVLDAANREQALLLTADKDFGELVYRQRRFARGIVLVRLVGLPPARKARVVLSVIGRHGSELPGSFTVVTPEAIRIRRLPGWEGAFLPRFSNSSAASMASRALASSCSVLRFTGPSLPFGRC